MDDIEHRKLQQLHARLTSHALAWPFLEPVDPVAMQLPTYFDIITSPMDLGTMGAKLLSRQYATPADYRADFRLMCANAIEFNQDDQREESVGEMAKRLLAFGLKAWDASFSEDATTDWRHVTLEQAHEALLHRAAEARLVSRWKRDSFVARLNRDKREQRQLSVASSTPAAALSGV